MKFLEIIITKIQIPPPTPLPSRDCVVIGEMVKNVMLNQVLNHALKQVQGLTNSGSSISASNKIMDLRDPETSSG